METDIREHSYGQDRIRPTGSGNQSQASPLPADRYDQKAEAAKAVRFMLMKAAIFILIPVLASILAILILL